MLQARFTISFKISFASLYKVLLYWFHYIVSWLSCAIASSCVFLYYCSVLVQAVAYISVCLHVSLIRWWHDFIITLRFPRTALTSATNYITDLFKVTREVSQFRPCNENWYEPLQHDFLSNFSQGRQRSHRHETILTQGKRSRWWKMLVRLSWFIWCHLQPADLVPYS